MRPATDAQRDYIEDLLERCADEAIDISYDYEYRAKSMVLTIAEASEIIDELKEALGWD